MHNGYTYIAKMVCRANAGAQQKMRRSECPGAKNDFSIGVHDLALAAFQIFDAYRAPLAKQDAANLNVRLDY